MKIVDRKTFLAMPNGTIFSKYAPCYFLELSVKEDSLPNDFIYQGLVTPMFTTTKDSGQWADQLDGIEAGEPSPPMDFDCTGRDGCFDADQLFAVWEKADVDGLIARLERARRDSDTHRQAETVQHGSVHG